MFVALRAAQPLAVEFLGGFGKAPDVGQVLCDQTEGVFDVRCSHNSPDFIKINYSAI